MPLHFENHPRARRGFVLFATATSAVAILGMVGLCLDLARLSIARNELQNYADAAAIAATDQLDGTTTGIDNAITEARTNVNKWHFDNNAVGTVIVDFATSPAGTFVANPNPAADYAFARIRARGSVPVHFLPIFAGLGVSRTVQATSVAGSPDAQPPQAEHGGADIASDYAPSAPDKPLVSQ
jgi:uncharacterized membrane protein